jgi:hypothetical protein
MKAMIIFFITVMLVACAQAADHCPASRKVDADNCAKKMFFLMDKSFVTLTKETLPAHCKKIDDSIKCVNNYGKDCLKGFTRQTLTVGLHGMKKHYRSICSKDAPLADKFIKSIDWVNKENIDNLYICASASIKNMKRISSDVKSEDQIPQACCSYWLARQCSRNKMQKMTTDEKFKFMEKLSDDAMTNMIEFLCSKQDSVQTCKKIMPEPIKVMEKIFSEAKLTDRNDKESYLIPFLDVIAE